MSHIIKKHSAGGVIMDQDRVLTISWTTHDYISFPKGGVNQNETAEDAAIREVFEETGYRAKILRSIGSWTYQYDERGERYEKKVDYFLMERVDDHAPTPHREPGEDFENLWLDTDNALIRLSFDDARYALEADISLRGSN